MSNIIFETYDKKYNKELNTWQSKENQAGYDGLNEFVVARGTLLGDYLTFTCEQLDDIKVKLAFKDNALVGFVAYSRQSQEHIHIEIMGINPECRGQGLSAEMLQEFKKQIFKNPNIKQLTLAVKNSNKSGIRAFSKVGTLSSEQKNNGYISFDL